MARMCASASRISHRGRARANVAGLATVTNDVRAVGRVVDVGCGRARDRGADGCTGEHGLFILCIVDIVREVLTGLNAGVVERVELAIHLLALRSIEVRGIGRRIRDDRRRGERRHRATGREKQHARPK
jgi:hypothetical protein